MSLELSRHTSLFGDAMLGDTIVGEGWRPLLLVRPVYNTQAIVAFDYFSAEVIQDDFFVEVIQDRFSVEVMQDSFSVDAIQDSFPAEVVQ